MRPAICALAILATAAFAYHLDNSNRDELQERLLGARVARIGEFPYSVSLRKKGNHFCGGALISNRHVITAAHCVYPFRKNLTSLRIEAWVGTNDLLHGGTSVKVLSTWYHPKYVHRNSGDLRYDIGAYVLEKALEFTKLIGAVKLPTKNPTLGTPATVTGWGVFIVPLALSQYLQKIEAKILDHVECSKKVPRFMKITDSHICTLVKRGVGTCIGDSGGPLVSADGELIGLVSGGIPCAIGYPDVYTNVYQYIEDLTSAISIDFKMEINPNEPDSVEDSEVEGEEIEEDEEIEKIFPYENHDVTEAQSAIEESEERDSDGIMI